MVTISKKVYAKVEDYRKDSYYCDTQGRFVGKLSEELKLENRQMDEELYKGLKEGYGLVQAAPNGEHREGWDITFSPDKSVGVLWVEGTAEQRDKIMAAHHRAVDYVRDRIEQDIQARDRNRENFKTGNMIAWQVDHYATREGDPGPHTHLVIFNITHGQGKHRAINSDSLMKRELRISQYESALAVELGQEGASVRGYRAESGKSIYTRVQGVDQTRIDAASGGKHRIDRYIEEHREDLKGQYPNAREGELRQIAGLKTRPHKESFSTQELERKYLDGIAGRGIERGAWLEAERAFKLERQDERETEKERVEPRMNEYDYVRTAARDLTEREATFTREELETHALRLSHGEAHPQAICNAINELTRDSELLHLDSQRNTREGIQEVYTTRRMYKMERNVVGRIRRGRGTEEPVIDRETVNARLNAWEKENITLGNDQRQAAENILTTKDRYIAVQGVAGSGKTTMIDSVRAEAEKEGYTVKGLAPTGQAAQKLEEGAHIQGAETVDRFLGRGAPMDSKTIVVVDEASMLSTQEWDALTRRADETGARMVVAGDTRQLKSIEAGDLYSELQVRKEMGVEELKEINRQKDEGYKRIVEDLSEKKVDSAFNKMEEQGRITEIADRNTRLDAISKDFLNDTKISYKDTIIVTARNADRRDLNDRIRGELQERGKVSKESHQFTIRNSNSLSNEEKRFAQNYRSGEGLFVKEKIAGLEKGKDVWTEVKVKSADYKIKISRAQWRELFQYDNEERRYILKEMRGERFEKVKLTGLEKGTEGRIISVDEKNHTITVGARGGRKVEIDLKSNGHKIETWREEQRDFSKGDKVVFTKNNRSMGVMNGHTGTIDNIDLHGNVTVRMRDGRNVKFDQSSYSHIDYGYAVTVHKSQGDTKEKVIHNADTKHRMSYNEIYTSSTRGRQDLKVYTNSKSEFQEQAKTEVVKRSTLNHDASERQGSKREHEAREFGNGRGRGDEKQQERSNGFSSELAQKYLYYREVSLQKYAQTGRRAHREDAEHFRDKFLREMSKIQIRRPRENEKTVSAENKRDTSQERSKSNNRQRGQSKEAERGR